MKTRIDGDFNDASPANQLTQASFTAYMENDTVSKTERNEKEDLKRTLYKGAGRKIDLN